MKRSKQYLILTLALFFMFLSSFFCFDIYFKGSDFDKKEIQFLTRQIQQLKLNHEVDGELQMQGLVQNNKASGRGIASIKEEKSEKDLSVYYFARAQDLKQKNKIDEAMTALEKVQKSTNPDYLARAEYEALQIQCADKNPTDECLRRIDFLVAQFPQSIWTGKSLAWLSSYYDKKNRKEDAAHLREIIKTEFAQFPELGELIKNDKKEIKKVY